MFHLHAIVRLTSAALRRRRQPPVRPACRRPCLEFLPDRVLPSIDLVSPGHPDYSPDFVEPEIERMRFMEVPQSGDLLKSWQSGAFSLSAKELIDIIGGPSHARQLGTPPVSRCRV